MTELLRMETGGGISPNAARATTQGDQSPAVRDGVRVSIGLRILNALLDVERATIAKLVEDVDACNRSGVRYHLRQLLKAGLVEEAGLIYQHGCIAKVMTYRLSRRLRGAA